MDQIGTPREGTRRELPRHSENCWHACGHAWHSRFRW